MGASRRFALGTYRGLQFGIVLHSQFAPDAYLEGRATRESMLSRDHHGPRAILNALERLANGYAFECDRVRRELGLAENQVRDYQARVGQPFLQDSYLCELTELRDRLKACLSGSPRMPGGEERADVAEIADRINAIKGVHEVEPAKPVGVES